MHLLDELTVRKCYKLESSTVIEKEPRLEKPYLKVTVQNYLTPLRRMEFCGQRTPFQYSKVQTICTYNAGKLGKVHNIV